MNVNVVHADYLDSFNSSGNAGKQGPAQVANNKKRGGGRGKR